MVRDKADLARQREIFGRVIQQERPMALAITVLAVCAVFIDMAWQSAVPMASVGDLLLQVGMGLAILGILAWHMVNPVSHIQRSLLGIICVACAGQIARLYLALFGFGWQNPPDLALPTGLNYLPLLTLALFAILPAPDAIRISLGLVLVLLVPTAIYVSFHLGHMGSSPRLVDLLHMALLINPLTFLLALMGVRVYQRSYLHARLESRFSSGGIGESDRLTMGFNRQGLERVLDESIAAAQLHHHELTVGLLELSPGIPEQDAGECLRAATEALRGEWDEAEFLVGRWQQRRLMFILSKWTVAPASSHCIALLEAFNGDASEPVDRRVNIALAAFHPGETQAVLLKRLDEELRKVRQTPGVGLSFPDSDAY